jgi:membrane protein DedA with SNARE-associated domain/rhodanese-related sulfurtransferase
MNAQLLALLEHYGVVIVFVAVLVDQVGLPLPAMPVLMIAASSVATGRDFLAALFLGSVTACLLADALWFSIGRTFGMSVLKQLCRISLEPDSCVSTTQTRFERWGVNSLLVARFVPGLGIIAPPLAGALGVGSARFYTLSAASAILWTTTGLAAGRLLHRQIDGLLARLQHAGGIAALAVLALLAIYVASKWWQRRRFYAQLRVARVGVDDLYRMMAAGAEPLIVDVRTHTARRLEPRWIPTAIHAPLEMLATSLQALPRDRDIVVYCTCPNEASAALVAKRLMSHGFKRVRPLAGGLDAWIAAGYGVESIVPDTSPDPVAPTSVA